MKHLIIAMVSVGICLLCFGMGEECGIKRGIEIQRQTVPLIEDVQTLLGVEPDGEPGPLTIKAWKEENMNQRALPYLKGM